MKRSDRPRHISVKAVLLALVLVVGPVILLFHLVAPVRIAGEWPMGITSSEVDRYARWTEAPWQGGEKAIGEVWHLGASASKGEHFMDGHSRKKHKRWLVVGEHADSVSVRRHSEVDGGIIITFPREAPFRGQRRVELLPASIGSMRAKYLEIIAEGLGLPVAEVSFVRLATQGDTAAYLQREWMGQDLLQKRMINDAVTYRQAQHPWSVADLFPRVTRDSLISASIRGAYANLHAALDTGNMSMAAQMVDLDAAIAWLVMCWLEGSPDPLRQRGHFAYRWESGRILPLYVPATTPPALDDGILRPWSVNPFSSLLRDEDHRRVFSAKLAQLEEERWRIMEGFAAADATWLPLLAGDLPLPIAKARVRNIQDAILNERLGQGDPVAFLDRQLIAGAGMANFLPGSSVGSAPTGPRIEDVQARLRRMRAVVAGDSIVFPRGKYVVEEDLLLPQGHAVVMLRGARFQVAPSVNILVRGDLRIEGTSLNPVFIRAQQGQPYGPLTVVGDGTAEVSISGLHMSGGGEGNIDGQFHAGMITIRGAASTTVVDSRLGGNKGEAVLSIKGGQFHVEDCVFSEAAGVMLDLSMVNGTVRNSTFHRPATNNKSPALNASGSRVLVEACRFIGIRDKAISAGEGSNLLVKDGHFEGNERAIAVHDLSVVHVWNNVFRKNVVVFTAYRKKAILGGGRLLTHGNTLENNAQEHEVDEHSELIPSATMDAAVMKEFTDP